MRWGLALLALFFILLLGCTEMTREQKNYCYSLASKSYSNVPDCFSEEACFEQAQKLFKTNNLDYSQRGKIYTLTNYLGRSWYFFNLAENENEKVSLLCKSGNISELPGTINQATFYFDSAFSELDKAIKESFDIVSAEESKLKKEEINLIKEEPIYDSLIELQQVLGELGSGPTNSETYISYYYERVSNFEKIAKHKEIGGLIEKRPLWLKVYEIVGKGIVIQVKKKEQIQIPFLGNLVENSVAFIENKIYYTESIRALTNFPVHEMMKLYSDVGGNKDSVVKRFADMTNRLNKNHLDLETTRTKLWKSLGEEVDQCTSQISKLSLARKYPLIEKRLDNLTFNQSLEEDYITLKQQIVTLRELKGNYEISKGVEITTLKGLINSFKTLSNQAILESDGLFQRMVDYCDLRAKEVKPMSIDTKNVDLLSLLESSKFYASKSFNEKDEKKLIYCEKMISETTTFSEALENFEEYQKKKLLQTADCFDLLEDLFKMYSSPYLESLFKELKNTPVTKENVYSFENACESILSQVNTEIKSDSMIEEISLLFEKLQSLKEKSNYFCAYTSNYTPCKKINKISEEYQKYFKNGTLSINEIFSIKEQLFQTLKKVITTAELEYNSNVINFAKNNYRLLLLSENIPSTNISFNSTVRLIVNNPFEKVNQPFSLNFEKAEGALLSKDPQIDEVNLERGHVQFSYLNKGTTKFDYSKNSKIETIENTKYVSVSNKESILQTDIQLANEETVPKILITAKKPKNTTKLIVFVDGDEKSFSDGDNISFLVEQVNNKTKISIFFYVTGIIALEKTLLSTTSLGLQTDKLTYQINAENRTSDLFDATILIPIGTSSEINSISVSNGVGEKQKNEIFANLVVLTKQPFFPQEKKQYIMEIKTTDLGKYYQQILLDLADSLIFWNELALAIDARHLSESTFDNSTVIEAEKFILHAQDILKKYKTDEEEAATLFVASETLRRRISELKQLITDLEDNGFYKESEILSKTIAEAKRFLDNAFLEDIAKANNLLDTIKFNPEQIIQEKSEQMWKEIQNLDLTDTNIFELKEHFFTQKQLLDESIGNPLELKRTYTTLVEIHSQILAQVEKMEILKNKESLSIELTLENLFLDANDKLIFLKKELSVSVSDLVKIKFIPPITLNRLKKIELDIIELKLLELPLIEKVSLLNDFINELDAAIDSIKLQAITNFNRGVDSSLNQETLKQSKSFIDSNNFTAALLILGSEQDSFSPVPLSYLGFIPIVVIVGLALFLRTKIKTHKKSTGEKKKEVSDLWEN